MKKTLLILIPILILAGCQTTGNGENAWVDLFDGKTLSGWTIRGGEGDFYVEDGMIVANSVLGRPNVFLCTEKEYSDFVLTYDAKIDDLINSGMQYRSHVWEKDTTTLYRDGKDVRKPRAWKAGRVWGYQVELDPTDRSWSGAFYEEGNRGWLVTLAENEAGRKAFKKGKWNSFKLKAVGNHIQIWVNGVLTTDETDDMSASGFFGIQLHGIKKEAQQDKKIRYKNIRIKDLSQ